MLKNFRNGDEDISELNRNSHKGSERRVDMSHELRNIKKKLTVMYYAVGVIVFVSITFYYHIFTHANDILQNMQAMCSINGERYQHILSEVTHIHTTIDVTHNKEIDITKDFTPEQLYSLYLRKLKETHGTDQWGDLTKDIESNEGKK